MATNVTVNTSYTTDNINNSDKTSSSSAVYSSSSAGDTPERILEKLLTVDSDDSGLNANTLQGKSSSDFATNEIVNTKLSKDGGSMNNTNLVTNLNAQYINGYQASDLFTKGVYAGDANDFPHLGTEYWTPSTLNKPEQGYGTVLNLQAGIDWKHQLEFGTGGDLTFRNNINSTGWSSRKRIWHSENSNLPTVDWTAKLMNASSNAGAGGYVSTGDYGGTGNASYHPSGIWANGAKNWLYGNNYYNGTQQAVNGMWSLTSDGNFTANGLIKAYRYSTANNLPAITMDKSGSYAYGIGPDGTNMRIRYGTAALDGSSWNTTGNAGIEHCFDGKVTVTGDIQGDTTFVSGFQGSGMRLNKDANNKYNLELDNLTVRGGMSIYELTTNKVRATNGALYVSDSGKIKSVSDGGTYFVIYLEDVNTFVAGDVVKCQIFTGSGVKSYIFKVEWTGSNASGDYVAFTKSTCWLQGGTGANIPIIGDTLVRIASDVANRQGNIYLTSSDTNSPYIQVVDGATSANLAGDVKVRLGKLDGITSTSFGSLSGYGLFTNNAVLDNARVSGNISAASGNIGGFNIASSSLSTNYIDLNNTTKSIDLYNTNSNVNSGIRFYYGEKNATHSYIARLNAYRHATEGDIFSIFVSNILNISANSVRMSDNLYVTDTTTTNYLTVNNDATTNDLYVNNNTVIYGNLSVNGITNINLPTYTLTYNTYGAWPSFSSLVFNGRIGGNVNNLNLTFYSSNSSSSWQKLGTITNFSTPGYDVYFTPTTDVGVGENSVGYIAATGEIFIKPGKGGQKYYGQVTWITA